MPTDIAARETLTRSIPLASTALTSLNRETRTIEVCLSMGSPVRRQGFIERLAIASHNVTVPDRLPVLDNHKRTSITDILGHVAQVRFEPDRIDATLRISSDAALDQIERGDLSGISIGYNVEAWDETAASQGSPRTRTATRWRLLEASLTPVPADPSAFIRGEDMPTQTTAAAEVTQVQQPQVETVTRAAANAQIRSIAEIAGLDATWANGQIDAEATIEAARAAAFTAMGERGAASLQIRTQVGVDHSDPAIIIERQAEALAQRMGGPAASDAAAQYVGFGFTDYARDALQRSGVQTERMSNEILLQRAMMTTSDFPLLLEQGGTRVVMNAYQAAESPLKEVASRRTVSDLRDVTVLKLGEASGLEEVTESGEIKHGSLGEGAESYKIKTFAKIFTLSRKLLVNDQFGVFGDMARQMGQLAATAEANALVSLLTANNGAGPTMSDGKRLFHADHGNLATAAAGLTLESLTAARLAMRSQKGLDGVTPVGVKPKYLVVGPALETQAEQILATLAAAAKIEDQNVFSGSLQLIVEPRLTGNEWYIFGDKSLSPVLEIASLASAPGPQISQREGWETLGREFRVVHDLGVGVLDHRGVYRNAGA